MLTSKRLELIKGSFSLSQGSLKGLELFLRMTDREFRAIFIKKDYRRNYLNRDKADLFMV
jgi:hypothetical protein